MHELVLVPLRHAVAFFDRSSAPTSAPLFYVPFPVETTRVLHSPPACGSLLVWSFRYFPHGRHPLSPPTPPLPPPTRSSPPPVRVLLLRFFRHRMRGTPAPLERSSCCLVSLLLPFVGPLGCGGRGVGVGATEESTYDANGAHFERDEDI